MELCTYGYHLYQTKPPTKEKKRIRILIHGQLHISKVNAIYPNHGFGVAFSLIYDHYNILYIPYAK